MIFSGQIERTPKQDDRLPDLLQEVVTKRTFTPNTHRTIQLNPHTSSSVSDKSSGSGKGFLDLFATQSNNNLQLDSSTSLPDYLGNIDLEELKKYHDFSTVTESTSIVAKYLKLKDMMAKKKKLEEQKKNSRYDILTKLLQNRRLDVEDDSDSKIDALKMLVKSNIEDSLKSQHSQLTGTKNDLGGKHMAYAIPSVDNLNMFNSQVEKPIQSPVNTDLQNLPFLVQDSNHYQVPMVHAVSQSGSPIVHSNTPNPFVSGLHSTLPFLDLNLKPQTASQSPVIASNFHDFVMTNPSSYQSPHQRTYNVLNNNLYGTSFVTPNHQHLMYKSNPYSSPVEYTTKIMNYLPQKMYQNDYQEKLADTEAERRWLEEKLSSLRRIESSLKKSNSLPLSGFPMNFEDMLSTGLKLAEQSQRRTIETQNVGQHIQPRTAPHQSWSNEPIHPTDAKNIFQQNQQVFKTDDFVPSQKIPIELMQVNHAKTKKENSYETSDIESNSIQNHNDKFHIIGPNCYQRSGNSFKLVGKSSLCVTASKSKKETFKNGERKSRGSNSIWDSITSLPFVNKFAKSFGIK